MEISLKDKAWLLEQFGKKVKSVTLLFSSTHHGWKVKDWREKCIGKS
jgi:hypothetical protein